MTPLLTVSQAAERLNVSPKLLRSLLREGVIPAIRVRRTWRIPPDALVPPCSPPAPEDQEEVQR